MKNSINKKQININKYNFQNIINSSIRHATGKPLINAYLRILNKQYSKENNKDYSKNFINHSYITPKNNNIFNLLDKSDIKISNRKCFSSNKENNNTKLNILEYSFLNYSLSKVNKSAEKNNKMNIFKNDSSNYSIEINPNINKNYDIIDLKHYQNNYNKNKSKTPLLNKKKNKNLNLGEKIYEKSIIQNLIKEFKLQEARKKIQDEEDKIMNNKNFYNSKSKKINFKKKIKPIFERIDEIKYKKLENLSKIQLKINEEKNIKYLKEAEPILKYKKKNKKNLDNYKSCDSFNNWLEKNENWNLNKKEKINKLKNDLNSLNSSIKSDNCTFKPSVNKTAKKININECSERLYYNYFEKCRNKKILMEQYKLDFKPKINNYKLVFKEFNK